MDIYSQELMYEDVFATPLDSLIKICEKCPVLKDSIDGTSFYFICSTKDGVSRFETNSMGGWKDVTTIQVFPKDSLIVVNPCKAQFSFRNGLKIGMPLSEAQKKGFSFKNKGMFWNYENEEKIILKDNATAQIGELVSYFEYKRIDIRICDGLICKIEYIYFQMDPIYKE